MKTNFEEHNDNLQMKLSGFATQYRSTKEGSIQEKMALNEYYKTFEQLVALNGGIVALDPDAELPDDVMPKTYVDFWLNGTNTESDSKLK